jgi:hypothetical protein
MRDGMKVVCVTPAGRRRYMRLLVPYVLSCPAVDRYDLWVNTDDPGDRAFLDALASVDPRIRLVPVPGGGPAGTSSIRLFYAEAMDPDTVYVRLDDDVVWLDPRFFETLLDVRLAHPEYFTVAPLVVNNALSSFLLQSFGRIAPSRHVEPARFDPVGWISPSFAAALHAFLQELIEAGEAPRLACGRIPVSANTFSINCIAWFGRDLAVFGGMPEPDEETAMSATLPLRTGRLNAVETAAMAAHFAFYTQRAMLDRSSLLEGYGRIAARRRELEPWRSRVEALCRGIDGRFPAGAGGGTAPPPSPPRARRSLLSRLFRKAPPPKHRPVDSVRRGPSF